MCRDGATGTVQEGGLGGCKFDRWLIVARGWVHSRHIWLTALQTGGSIKPWPRPNPYRRVHLADVDQDESQTGRDFFFVVQLASKGVTRYLSLAVWIP
jgi:hypothetical protein